LSRAIELSQKNDASLNPKIVEMTNQAIDESKKAIAANPDDARGYAQQAKIYQTIKGYMPEAEEIAIASWQQAIQLAPNNADYCQTLSELLIEAGQVKQAVFYLQAAAKADLTNPNRLKQLAKLQVQAGMIAPAKITYQQLLGLLTQPEQKKQIEAEIASLNQLLAEAASNKTKDELPIEKANQPVILTLPDSPPLLQAQHLANNTYVALPEEKENLNQVQELSTNALSGTGVISAGEAEIKICNDYLSPNTQVYLVPEDNKNNQILFIKNKGPGNPDNSSCPFFTAAIKKPLKKDLSFRWWVIEE
jgi:tetratricopeptide (TPR) repeat protein